MLSLWQGLGYYTRARNLHQAAQVIHTQYDGIFPDTYEDIRALPGIGDYTAGAVASIAFNQSHPAVDGNVLRVLARFKGIDEDITHTQIKNQISKVVAASIPQGQAGTFNQALMELGATCCLPKNPQCSHCPLSSGCEAYRTDRQDTLPIKRKAKTARTLDYTAAVICKDGFILMEYRDSTRLLQNMWGVPLVSKEPDITAEAHLQKDWGLNLRRIKTLGQVNHVFTHQVWQMEAVLYAVDEEIEVQDSRRHVQDSKLPTQDASLPAQDTKARLAWIPVEELADLPIPKAFRKVLVLVNQEIATKPHKIC